MNSKLDSFLEANGVGFSLNTCEHCRGVGVVPDRIAEGFVKLLDSEVVSVKSAAASKGFVATFVKHVGPQAPNMSWYEIAKMPSQDNERIATPHDVDIHEKPVVPPPPPPVPKR